MSLKIVPILIITSLLAVGLFGIFGISMVNSSGQHSCPVSALSSNDCSPSNSPLIETFHHISTLQNFAQGPINTNTFSSILILLLLALTVFLTLFPKTPSLETSPQRGYYKTDQSEYSQKKQFLRWLALRQKRDPHALQWVHDYS